MQKKQILWADDEIDLLQPHIMFLQSKGYDVDTVTNGDDAIAKASENNYHIILLDEMMTGKDGLETLQQIKSSSPPRLSPPVGRASKVLPTELMVSSSPQKVPSSPRKTSRPMR